MVKYECIRCNYETDQKARMRLHIHKKIPCPSEKSDLNVLDYEEEILNKGEQYLLDKIKKLEAENESLKKQLAEKPTNINTQNNTTIGRDQNINITIQLRPYNDPQLADDMDDIYEDAWSKKKSIPTFIERLHLNGDMPENHNMCITNLRTKLAKVFTEQGWMTKDQDLLLDEIISNTSRMMDKWVKAKKGRREYENDFIEYLDEIGKKRFNEDTKKELKLMLYDAYKNGMVDIRSGTKQHIPLEEEEVNDE
jgi:hypothetical protein